MEIASNTEYPQDRNFRIIAVNCPEAHAEIVDILRQHGIILNPQQSNLSGQGKYRSYTISATFGSPTEITQLSEALAQAEHVKYVL